MNTRQGHAISEALQKTAVQNVVSTDPKMSQNASPPCFFYLFAYGLFNNAIGTSVCITSNSRTIMNWKKCRMEWSKAGIRYYPRVIPAWTEANHEDS